MERRGINHIAHLCAQIGVIWRESSNSDVGFDGEIELVEGTQATGQIVKVQGKAGQSYLKNEQPEQFDFYTDLNRLEYWRDATNPILLVIYDPRINKAYLKDVKNYLRSHPEVFSRPHKIRFEKRKDLFHGECATRIKALFGQSREEFETDYRQHIIDRHGKLTLYAATLHSPVAVDLESIFVQLTVVHRQLMSHVNLELGAEIMEAADKSDRLDPLASSSGTLPPRPRPAEETILTLTFNEALREHPVLAMTGRGGAGKTTMLSYLALTFARQQAKQRLHLDEDRLPVLVPLRDFSRFLDNLDKQGRLLSISPSLLPQFLAEYLKDVAPHLASPAGFFERALAEGTCAVLCDGLDEIADPMKRTRASEAVANFIRYFRRNRFVITSRPRGYEGESKQRLSLFCTECVIRDFDEDDIRQFVHLWYKAVKIGFLGDVPTAGLEASSGARELLLMISNNERLKALARNPLLLSVLAMVHQRRLDLPQRRAELYDECIDMLLGYADQVKGGVAARELAAYGGLDRNEKRALLEQVALWFHERGESGQEAERNELVLEISRQFEAILGKDSATARRSSEPFLRLLEERTGLIVENGVGMFAFAHISFQEYLAARAVAHRDDFIGFTLDHLRDPWWREVILLEVGHLSDDRHFSLRSRKLTGELIRNIWHANSWMESVLHRDLLFAARCLADSGKLAVPDDLRRGIIDDLLRLWRHTPYEPQRREILDVFDHLVSTVDGSQIFGEVCALTNDSQGDIRRLAAFALGHMGAVAGPEDMLSSLEGLLKDSDNYVRAAAVFALGRMGKVAAKPKIVEQLLALFEDENEDDYVRSATASALKQMGQLQVTPETLERMVALCGHSDSWVRCGALSSMARMGVAAVTPRALERLISLSLDNNPNVPYAVARVFAQMGTSAVTTETLKSLVKLSNHNLPWVRAAAVYALGRMGPSAAQVATLDKLLDLTADREASVRSTACDALGQMGRMAARADVLERLFEIASDKEPLVRRAAASTLGMLAQTAASPRTMECLVLLSNDSDAWVRSASLHAIGQMAQAAFQNQSLPPLTELVTDSNPEARAEAAFLIGQVAHNPSVRSTAVAHLLKLLQDDTSFVRWAAARALAEIGTVTAIGDRLEYLLRLLKSEDEDLQIAAAFVLGRFSKVQSITGVLEELIKFFQFHLHNTQFRFIGSDIMRACDFAYQELRQIAEISGPKGVLSF